MDKRPRYGAMIGATARRTGRRSAAWEACMNRQRISVAGAGLAVLAGMVVVTASGVATATTSTTTASLHRVGTTTLKASGPSSTVTRSGLEFSPEVGEI